MQHHVRTVAFSIAMLTLLIGPTLAQDVEFGDDASEWANDGECDDPRFTGPGVAAELVDVDLMHDATDCREAFENGTATLRDDSTVSVANEDTDDISSTDTAILRRIEFGDDTGEWPNDGECDDPDFTGPGMADKPSTASRMRDAADCRAAFAAGTVSLNAPVASALHAFDYGADWSRWANDGECDDLRFVGEGTDKKLLTDDLYGDATDCRTLEAAGKVAIRKVYTPAYAAGAPYDASHVDFGDDSSSYANDDRCDDPRFEGPGAASVLLESDERHDAADCKAAYEAGTVILISEGE